MINTTEPRKAGIHDEVFGIKMLMSRGVFEGDIDFALKNR